MASVAALAALDPQLTPDGAALVALVVGNHRQALCWAALVTLVAPATAPSAALGLQQAPAGVALACRQWHLGHQLVPVAIFPHPVVARVSSVAAWAALTTVVVAQGAAPDHQQASAEAAFAHCVRAPLWACYPDHQQAPQPYAGAALVVIVAAAPVVVVHQQAPPGAAHTMVVAAVALPPP